MIKKIKFDKSKYDFRSIKREVEYFERVGFPLIIDHEFCVYAIEGRKRHWLGYAKPVSLAWFDAQFDCDQGGRDVGSSTNSRGDEA